MKTLLLILLFPIALLADSVDITWDAPLPSVPPQAVVKYHIYEKIGSGVIKIAENAPNQRLLHVSNVSPGQHVYFVTAFGINGLESLPSNSVVYESPVPAIPVNPPLNTRAAASSTP